MKRNLFLSFPKAARLLLAALICLPFWGTALMAQTAQPEAYAVFDSSTRTLTFKYDNSKPSGAYLMNTGTDFPGWYADRQNIKKVLFDPSFAGARPTSCSGWFYGCQDLADIEGISNLNTEKVTDMYFMFSDCSSLTSLDLSSFNTENVTNMISMFNKCSSLASLDLSSFNTKNVTDMYGMFNYCEKLKSIDLSSFNTGKVNVMGSMFQNCTALTTIYASDKFVTTRVVYGTGMFDGCTALKGAIEYDASKTDHNYANLSNGYFSLKPIIAYAVFDSATGTLTFKYDGNKPADAYLMNTGTDLPGWNEKTDKIKKVVFDPSFAGARPTSCYSWFASCRNLADIEGISNLNTENVTDMSYMFSNCISLDSLDLSSFNTENVTNMSLMFFNCKSLASLDLSSFNTKSVTDMSNMFLLCTSLDSLNLSSFNTENVTDLSGMFSGCTSLTSLDLSSFNTENVTNMRSMFNDCTSLTSLDLSSFNTENVTNMIGMFDKCTSLASLDLSSFNTENVTNMYGMFYKCTSLASLNLYSFNTENVTDMSWMFYKCTSLTSLDLSSFNTDSLKYMKGMFQQCSSLTSLDLSSLNTEKVTYMSSMFKNCTALTTIYASDKFVTTSVTDGTDMFKGCTALKGAIEYDASKTDHSYANFDGYFRHRIIGTGMYAEFDSATGVLTFKNGDIYDGNYPVNEGYESPAWLAHSKSICKVVFDPSVAEARPTSCASWFLDCIRLTEIEGLEHLNTDSVTIMRSMFEGCEQLTAIDLSLLSTAEVTDMERMFANCYRLKSINLSNLNTEKVTDMIEMFYYCKALTAIDLSKFNTANVTDMKGMFRECAALTAVDVSMFDTRNVKNMEGMFAYCHGLTTLDLSDFDTENVWNTYEMFSNCSALTTIYVSDKFVTTNVTHSRYMFHACEKLKGAREYDVTKTNHSYANYTTGYFTLKVPTSIDAINGNDKAEYFDINGKRGTKLQRGINLVRRGNKTYKVVVK